MTFELVYSSVAKPHITRTDIDDILLTARAFNGDNQITGCLLFYNYEFAQILEGEESIVLELFESIKKDSRHDYIVLLGTSTKTSRLFPTWSMAYKDLQENNSVNFDEGFVKNFMAFSDLAHNSSATADLFFQISKHILDSEIE